MSMVIAENIAFKATPSNNTVDRLALFKDENQRTIKVQIIAKTKDNIPVVAIPTSIPIPENTISAMLAPNTEALEIPRVDGEASGLFNTD